MAPITSPDPVHLIAHYSLRCSNKASVAALESPFKLGPMDELMLPFVFVQTVFVYRKPDSISEDKLLDIQRLRQALSYLLDYYPHLTGRLRFDPETHAPEIVRLGRGAELCEASCDLRLDDLVPPNRATNRLLVTDLPDCGRALTSPFDLSMEGGVYRGRLLAIQHTRFACGGVVLGVGLHHIVCDYNGYFQLIRGMAEIYRGLSSSPHPTTLAHAPLIRSHLWDTSSLSPQEKQEAIDYKPAAYRVNEPKPADTATQSASKQEEPPAADTVGLPEKPPVIGRILRFSGKQLHGLKTLASEPDGKRRVTTFEALTAYFYQRLYRARYQLLISQDTPPAQAAAKINRGIYAAINMRTPDRLDLGPNYFPNAIYPCYISLLSHELLLDGDLWMVTQALHDQLRATDATQMEQTARWIAVQPDKARVSMKHPWANGGLTVTQWSEFNTYTGVDFDVDGGGRAVHPTLVSPPSSRTSRLDGLALFMSTEEDLERTVEGDEVPNAVDVILTVVEPVWLILAADEELRGYCCF